MPFSTNHLAELNLLSEFQSSSTQEGIKVHTHTAAAETVAAAQSLFAKGMISQKDGGYLTPMGAEAVELTQKLQAMLNQK